MGIGLPLLLAGCLLLLGLALTEWRSPSFPTDWNDGNVRVIDEPSEV